MTEKKDAKPSEAPSPPGRRLFAGVDPWASLWGGPSGFGRRPFTDLLRVWPQLPRAASFAPAVDLCETDTHYIVTVELPGVQKEAVQLELQGGVLVIRGEKKSEREQKNERGRYLERSYGSFRRSFTLPEDADAWRLEASFADGVLTIRVPRGRAESSKRIPIQG